MPKKKVLRKKVSKKKINSKRTPIKAPSTAQLVESVGWPWPLRHYQQDVEDAFNRGIDRFMLNWHRRAGKDVFSLMKARQESVKRVGAYVHFFPKHVQAKRALWRGVDPKTKKKFIDTAFGDLEAARNNQDMFLDLINGSTWQLLGSDTYDSVVGSNIVGAIFSEWALCDPRAWDFISPMILENNGWAMFVTTFRGRGHAWQMAQRLKDEPDWYVDLRTVEDTHDLDGNRIITDEQIEKERREGKSEAIIEQEYYCNPQAVQDGAIYGKQVEALRKDTHRHTAIWNPQYPVYAVWNFDLPVFASCVYVQRQKDRVAVLDAQTWTFTTLGEAVAACYRQPFPIQKHLVSGRQQDIVGLMMDLRVYPEVQQIQSDFVTSTATANLLNTCCLDYECCEELLDSLGGYVRRERFDAHTADVVYSDKPAPSYHAQLSQALETWAVYDHLAGKSDWSSEPDYSVQDMIARTLA